MISTSTRYICIGIGVALEATQVAKSLKDLAKSSMLTFGLIYTHQHLSLIAFLLFKHSIT